jgi:hypothetical protein
MTFILLFADRCFGHSVNEMGVGSFRTFFLRNFLLEVWFLLMHGGREGCREGLWLRCI